MAEKLCICIPTRNRSEIVEEILAQAYPAYSQLDVSVAYFDSSDGGETERLVRAYQSRGCSRLYYYPMPGTLCIDRKLFEIFKREAARKKYRYLWLVNDATLILPSAVKCALACLERGYDLIRFSPEGDGSREDFVSDNADEWFQRASNGIAHMASTIMGASLLRASPDWDLLYQKYIVTDRDNTPGHEYFFTVGFYYEQLAKLPHFHGLLLGNRAKWRQDSFLKEKSFWSAFPFEVWARSYPSTIQKLPEVYTRKEDVIRQSDNIRYGRFERQSMIAYRIQGILTPETAEQYAAYWPLVSTLSPEEIYEIASLPAEECRKRFGADFGRADAWKTKLEEIERHMDAAPVIVYGAGQYGEYVIRKLKQDGFGCRIAGVAVSDETVNVDSVDGVPVRSIQHYTHLRETAAVLIATRPDAALEIQETLGTLGFRRFEKIFGRDDAV